MDFKEATDRLFGSLDAAALADQLDVSVQAVCQARSRPDTAAHREPPPQWREGVIRLAEKRMLYYRQLITELREDL